MITRIHRRNFLRGVGGVAVAAPFLSSVLERQAKGQTVAKQKQFIGMFTHYGCVTTKFFPTKSHGALVASDIANSLSPLAPYVNKLLIPRGRAPERAASLDWRGWQAEPKHRGNGQAQTPRVRA